MPDELLCATFNQDSTHVAVGTGSGWRIYACGPSFSPCQTGEPATVGVGAVQMLGTSSLVALAGGGSTAAASPKRLQMWNASAGKGIFELSFGTAVLRVLLNHTRLIVVLEAATHIYELSTMRQLHLLETANNPRGLAALSVDATAPSLCAILPGPALRAEGRVVLFDATHGHFLSTLAAHHSPIAAVALSASGEMLATASEKGTLIRVHAVPQGALLHVFRRGAMRATIQCLAFSVTSAEPPPRESGGGGDGGVAAAGGDVRRGAYLCASSSTGTVHVWRLLPHDERHGLGDGGGGGGARGSVDGGAAGGGAGAEGGGGLIQVLRRGAGAAAAPAGALGSVRSLVRTMASSVQAQRDIARVRLKLPPGATTMWCAVAIRDDALGGAAGGERDGARAALHVVTQRGAYYAYRLDLRGTSATGSRESSAGAARGGAAAGAGGGGGVLLLDERRLLEEG